MVDEFNRTTAYIDPVTGNVIRIMPPCKLWDQMYINMLTLWLMCGMTEMVVGAGTLSSSMPIP